MEVFFQTEFTEKSREFLLIEFPEGLKEEVKKGSRFLVKGGCQEEAVLVSEKETFVVRSHETSNMLLVEQEGKLVSGAQKVIVLEKGVPPFDRVYRLLERSALKFPDQPLELYTYQELLEECQVSQAELQKFLSQVGVVELDNKIRMIDNGLVFEVMSAIFEVKKKLMWSYFYVERVVEEVREYPEVVKQVVMSCLGEFESGDELVWIPNRLKMYKAFALEMFRLKIEYFVEEFEQAFIQMVNMVLSQELLVDFSFEEILEGICVSRIYNGRKTYKLLIHWTLPFNSVQRLSYLFEIKPKYCYEELKFYMEEVLVSDFQKILMKFTRRISENNQTYYISKIK